jgi:hypothetical protein
VEDGKEKPTAGYELLEQLNNHSLRIPVIFYTTNAANKRTAPQVRAYGAPVADVPRDLVNMVIEALSES